VCMTTMPRPIRTGMRSGFTRPPQATSTAFERTRKNLRS
jgi:hypothetical protein